MRTKKQHMVENKGEGWEPRGAGRFGAAVDPDPPMLFRLSGESLFTCPLLIAPPPTRERRQRVPGTGWGGLSWKHQINVNRKTFYAFSPLK